MNEPSVSTEVTESTEAESITAAVNGYIEQRKILIERFMHFVSYVDLQYSPRKIDELRIELIRIDDAIKTILPLAPKLAPSIPSHLRETPSQP